MPRHDHAVTYLGYALLGARQQAQQLGGACVANEIPIRIRIEEPELAGAAGATPGRVPLPAAGFSIAQIPTPLMAWNLVPTKPVLDGTTNGVGLILLDEVQTPSDVCRFEVGNPLYIPVDRLGRYENARLSVSK